MVKHKIRIFHNQVTDVYFVEQIRWGVCGTGNIELNDPRAVMVDGDMSIPLSILNPGFDINALNHTYEVEQYTTVDGEGNLVTRTKKVKVLSFTPMDIYSQPLLPNVIEIDQETYNNRPENNL